MQLRSGATTGGGIPNQIEITTPQRQEGDEDAATKGMKMLQHQGHLFKHHKCTQQEPMWRTLGDHHLCQQTLGQFNSLSYHSQIIGQQGSQVFQEIQTTMEGNLMDLM